LGVEVATEDFEDDEILEDTADETDVVVNTASWEDAVDLL
jgi:hypothetical protein